MDRKFICDPDLDGCVCMPWYKGTPDECSALINLASAKQARADELALAGHHTDGSSSLGTIFAVIAAILLVLLGVLAFVYTRRRRLRAAKYADADFSVTYSPGSEFNIHENPRLGRSVSSAGVPPSSAGRSDSIVDNPNYSLSGSIIAEAPAFRSTSNDGIISPPVASSTTSAEPVFHGVTADVPNNKRTNMPRKITNIERVKLGPLAEEQYRVPVPKAAAAITSLNASAAEAKARHFMDLQNRQGGAVAGPSTSNNSLASGAYEDIVDMPSTSAKSTTYAPQSTSSQYAATLHAVGKGNSAGGSVVDSEHPYSTIEDSEELMRRLSAAQNSSYFELPPITPRPAPPTNRPPALPKSNGNPFGNDDFAKQSSVSMPKPLSPKRFS